MRLIDFHTHILPGIDDGSKTIEESIAMLKELKSQGVSEVNATSHFYGSRQTVDEFIEKRDEAYDALTTEIEARNLKDEMPDISLGAEVYYFEGITMARDLDKLAIEGKHILLLEMPFSPWTDRMLRDILTINTLGNFQVMLAHIDRYLNFIKKGDIEWLVSNGILIQANADFFINPKTRRQAVKMIKKGLIHTIGSDCHNMTNRSPNTGEADRIIRKYL